VLLRENKNLKLSLDKAIKPPSVAVATQTVKSEFRMMSKEIPSIETKFKPPQFH